jgi:hypothetical protein
MLPCLSGQMTSDHEGLDAKISVIMLSTSSYYGFFKKSTSTTYSVIMVDSFMDLFASTVNLQKNIIESQKWSAKYENFNASCINTYPSTGSKTTMRGGHSPLSIILLHMFRVSVSSFDKT